MAGRDGHVSAGHADRERAGHADRERAIGVLKAAFVQGRLDAGEFDARVGGAFAARTYGELAALTADIPAAAVAEPVAASAAELVATADARPALTPRQTLARASRRAGGCMLVVISLVCLSFLTQQFDLLIPAVFAFIAAYTVLGYGVVDAVQQRRSRGRLPPRPDPSGSGLDGRPGLDGGFGLDGGKPGEPGEPGARFERIGADLRVRRPGKAGSRRGRPAYA